MSKLNKLVIFDVDKTLIKRDSLIITAIHNRNLLFLAKKFIYLLPYYLIWIFKIISTKKFKEKFIETFEICEKINQIDKSNSWLDNLLIKEIRKEAFARIEMHKQKGDFVVLCSASPRMIIEPLAIFLKVQLICTEMYSYSNKWIPKIKGKNCNGIEKLNRLKKEFDFENYSELEVYGDSKGDKQILEAADIPHFKSFDDNSKNYPYFSIVSLLPILGLVFFVYSLLGEWALGPKELLLIKTNFVQIFFGLILISLGYFLRFLRWRYYLGCFGINVPFKIDFLIWMGSFAFTATPGKTGESIRSYILNKKFKIKYQKTLLALAFERLTDFLAVVLICSLNINFLRKLNFQLFDFLKSSFFILTIIFLIIYLLIRISFTRSFLNHLRVRYGKLLDKFVDIRNNFNLKSLLNCKVFLISLFLCTISWTLEGVSFFLILRSFNAEINLSESVFIHVLSGLIGAISLIPGGVGSAEISSISLLAILGIPIAVASSSTIIIRIMTLWYSIFIGISCLTILQGKRFKKI